MDLNFIIRLYGLFVSLWFVANQFFQDAWWPFVVLDKFAEYFLVASVPILLISLFTKKKLTMVLAVLPVLVTGYFYMPLLKPAGDAVAVEANDTLRIATYNIWNHNKDLAGVVELLRTTNADVVAVQEITDVQQEEFVERMSALYPHYLVSEQVYGGTTALFSKLDLYNVQELNFNIDRPAVIAEVKKNGSAVAVVSAHLNPSFWAYHDQPLLEIPRNYHRYIKDQNTQASMIIDALSARDGLSGAVLACDCNSQETASTNRLLSTYFKDAFRFIGLQLGEAPEAGLQYERKLSHIDYVWFAGDIKPVSIFRAKSGAGSDHAPVMADFYIAAED